MVTRPLSSGHMAWTTVKTFQVQREDRIKVERWYEVGQDREAFVDWLDALRELVLTDRMGLVEAIDQMRAVIHAPRKEEGEMTW